MEKLVTYRITTFEKEFYSDWRISGAIQFWSTVPGNSCIAVTLSHEVWLGSFISLMVSVHWLYLQQPPLLERKYSLSCRLVSEGGKSLGTSSLSKRKSGNHSWDNFILTDFIFWCCDFHFCLLRYIIFVNIHLELPLVEIFEMMIVVPLICGFWFYSFSYLWSTVVWIY